MCRARLRRGGRRGPNGGRAAHPLIGGIAPRARRARERAPGTGARPPCAGALPDGIRGTAGLAHGGGGRAGGAERGHGDPDVGLAGEALCPLAAREPPGAARGGHRGRAPRRRDRRQGDGPRRPHASDDRPARAGRHPRGGSCPRGAISPRRRVAAALVPAGYRDAACDARAHGGPLRGGGAAGPRGFNHRAACAASDRGGSLRRAHGGHANGAGRARGHRLDFPGVR